jgi:hypothetical protein
VSNFIEPQTGSEQFPLLHLPTGTFEALAHSARRNGRTVHEEAEHIIKTHLAASDEGED